MVFTTDKKIPNIWTTFVIKFVPKKFQKIAQSGHTATDYSVTRW